MLLERSPTECRETLRLAVSSLVSMKLCEGCALIYTASKYNVPLAAVRRAYLKDTA